MCGIVAVAGLKPASDLLLTGLHRLEYRGYDSCGIATVGEKGLQAVRSVSRVKELEAQVESEAVTGPIGIAHTRWATHGEPAVRNAHPMVSEHIALVHNGIIENYQSLRSELMEAGYVFKSDTDTEVIAHLVNQYYEGDLLRAVEQAVLRLRGSYAIAVISEREPHRLVAARHGSPMVLGIGKDEHYIASDAVAVAGETDQIVYLEDGDVLDVKPEGFRIFARQDYSFVETERPVRVVHAFAGAVDLGPYRHYMQKEIFEQPRAVADTLEGIGSFLPAIFGTKAETLFPQVRRVLFLGCGTSYYAALTAKYWIEELAGIPCEVEIASEYRYRTSVPSDDTLVVTISQSGETADTLAALRHARDTLGMTKTLTICNVPTSAMVHESEMAYITRAGVEIGVASTKAFTTQLTALYLLALVLANVKGRLTDEQIAEERAHLAHLPEAIRAVLALEEKIVDWAGRFSPKHHALFLGRGVHYPIAMEGALKLKEITYIHAEAYPAGELKHGPLALVDQEMPVVTVAPNDALLEKLKSNMQEVRARGGELYVFADADTRMESEDRLHVIRMPEHYGRLSPILHVIPLQLLAYHTALARGTDVDKPRNLAKSVTVE